MSAGDREEATDAVAPHRRFACREFGEPGEAEARHRALADSHESVLAALARILFGREEAHREEPWSQPCCRDHDDDRGLDR